MRSSPPCRLAVVAAVPQERSQMRDDVLERLALDLRAPELDIALDIGGGSGRQLAALGSPRARKSATVDRCCWIVARKSPCLGQMPEVMPARHVQGGGFGRLQPAHGCQKTREGPLRAPIRFRRLLGCKRFL